MAGWFDDEEAGGDENAVRADPRADRSGWDVATDWVTDEAGVAAASVSTTWDEVSSKAEQAATEFAHNAETQFADDPVGFVGRATGAPDVKYDTDSSDGTLGLHVQSVYGTVDADWKDGQGSKVHSQLGMDWGVAPYVATDLATDDNGEITKASGTAKLTIPLEVADVKAEATGGYEKTADGYKANFSESGGASVDGVEMMIGLHGGIQDNGEHGATVTAGPHGSVGMGEGGMHTGLDPIEGALKGSTDFTYGEQDGQTTLGVSQTTGAEVKAFGQTVAQGQNTVGIEHTEGPQGERTSVYDTLSGTVGNQKFGGAESASEQVKYTYGTDAAGNEVSQVTTTTQVTETNGAGQQTPLVNDTDTYDVQPVDAIQPVDVMQPVDDMQLVDVMQPVDALQAAGAMPPLDAAPPAYTEMSIDSQALIDDLVVGTEPPDVESFGPTDVLDFVDSTATVQPNPIDLPVVDVFEPADAGAPELVLAPEEPPAGDFGEPYMAEPSIAETSILDDVSFDFIE